MEERPIDSITVGRRHRQDMGDISALAASIASIGLLHPIVIRPDGQLIVGERRLRAYCELGLAEIPVNVAYNLTELRDLLLAEADENTCRENYRPDEAVAQAADLDREIKRLAKERQQEHGGTAPGKPKNTSGKLPEVSTGRVRDQVGKLVGLSGKTYEKAKAVVKSRNPKLIKEMHRTGKVDGAYRKLKRKQDEAQILAVEPVAGQFRTIVIDPPWDYKGLSLAGRAAPTYAVMSQAELLALPVAACADSERGCHLYLWSTNNFMPRAIELMAAWGFAYKTLLTWIKPSIGLGTYFRNSTEQVLFGVRGDLKLRAADAPTHFTGSRGKPSEKPAAFFKLVERVSYPPYLDAFARKPREAWSVWGNITD